ncbi:WD40/YVTN repeat-like-containing domain superfamily [Sesbania bispinosa]|nr:WD40/YVTN repeat-like-containing domain superfamily [Sesbania bispinosa]
MTMHHPVMPGLLNNIGRLGSLIRENDEFFELISSKFLSETRYTTSNSGCCCQASPELFANLDDENTSLSAEEQNLKRVPGSKEASDSEMLKTYSTGSSRCVFSRSSLLFSSHFLYFLIKFGMILVEVKWFEDVFTSGLPAKFMRYLRLRVLGETSISQKDTNSLTESRHCIWDTSMRGKDDGRNRFRQKILVWMNHPDGLSEGAGICEVGTGGEDRWHCRDIRDVRVKYGDHEDNARDDSSKRRVNCGWGRSREKGRVNEGNVESEPVLSSPGSGSRLVQGKSVKDRNILRNVDIKMVPDSKKSVVRINSEANVLGRDDNDDCFKECYIGSKDISNLVRKAVQAAEAEARSANAPEEAVKAAGDAAAELEFKSTNDEEAAVLAASKATSTVIDAASAVEVSRSSISINKEIENADVQDRESGEEVEDYFIPDTQSLLQILNNREASKVALLLPDVMKLICALAAHRKFAALFVDRGAWKSFLLFLEWLKLSLAFLLVYLLSVLCRVCALSSDVVYHLVELALQLLECNQDQARKNAALFFAAAFVFRAVLDAFDAQDGLQKLLGLLNDAALLRSGVNSGALGLSNAGSLRNDRSSEVLTSSEKQIAYHTCVALRQYFRAHLLLLVDSIRPTKANRSAARNLPSVRAAYKPLDISNEAMDAVLLQLQKDRKLGSAFAPPVERYLHDLLQYALGVLHIVTLVPSSRKMIVNATLSNNRVGTAIILDAANIASNHVDPEIIQPALNVLVNLVCPPPSISNKPALVTQGQQSASAQTSKCPLSETRDRTSERNVIDRSVNISSQTDPRERNGDSSAVDRDSSGSSSAGLAAQLVQGYRQAREAVRANNGIKVLLHLLQPRIYSPPAALDCLRALACRVLLGLARDDTIAHILTKLQVGKKLSELIRDSGSQTHGTEQGRASTLAATDAATPTLRRIERAAIAAATPITYHSRELLLLIHEHLQASGLSQTASMLLKEAQLKPLPSVVAPSSLAQQPSTQEAPPVQLQWPSGRAPGFLSNKLKLNVGDGDSNTKIDSAFSSKKKSLNFSSSFGSNSRHQLVDFRQSSVRKLLGTGKESLETAAVLETPSEPLGKHNIDAESQYKTPIILPMKRKLYELKDIGVLSSSGKRLYTGDQGIRSPICPTPHSIRRSNMQTDAIGLSTPSSNLRNQQGRSDYVDENQNSMSTLGQVTPSSLVINDLQHNNSERITLDSLVVQYLKHQHRQCPAPITTLPPLSLLHPHVCPEPKRSLDAPSNVTARLGTREFKLIYGGVHGNRRDRQFVYSRFRPWRTCRDDAGALLTCISFVGDSSHIAVGSHNGELKLFDANNNNAVESFTGHQYPLTLVQSFVSGETQLLLSSSSQDVRLWDASSILSGTTHSFEGCKAARFSNAGNVFAALSSESSQREILLYDIQTCQLESKLSDTSTNFTGRGHIYSLIHFNPSDSMLLWNGILWDRRVSGPVHRFDQFTDYGGGGFHPAGNEEDYLKFTAS